MGLLIAIICIILVVVFWRIFASLALIVIVIVAVGIGLLYLYSQGEKGDRRESRESVKPKEMLAEDLVVRQKLRTADGMDTGLPIEGKETKAGDMSTDTGVSPLPQPHKPEPIDILDMLLGKADRQIANNRLTTPIGDNAYETIQEALRITPGHPGALQRLETIVNRYKGWAKQSIAKGQWKKAENLILRVKKKFPEDPELNALMVKVEVEKRKGMVWVPAGEFFMGCNETVEIQCESDEKPGRRVYLDAFHIDKFEVTVADYRKCVLAGTCKTPNTGGKCNWDHAGREDHPINCVDWHQAYAYCKWAGRRLPTEAEWEKAARGTDGRKYPWGNNWDSSKANTWDAKQTVSVGSYSSGRSPYGAHDMAGNVWEWVHDRYDKGYYRSAPNRNSKGPSSGSARVVRGGSWAAGEARYARASARHTGSPGRRYGHFGFRCSQ